MKEYSYCLLEEQAVMLLFFPSQGKAGPARRKNKNVTHLNYVNSFPNPFDRVVQTVDSSLTLLFDLKLNPH